MYRLVPLGLREHEYAQGWYQGERRIYVVRDPGKQNTITVQEGIRIFLA